MKKKLNTQHEKDDMERARNAKKVPFHGINMTGRC
jgi:hypothetical protein